MSRLLVANLDCELDYARELTPGPHKELPRAVARAISHAGLAMRVFANQGDSLWVLSALDADVAGPGLVCGPFASLGAFEHVLPWGQSKKVPLPTAEIGGSCGTWQEQIWGLRTSPEVAAACNDRRFSLRIDIAPKWTLPSIACVDGLDALDEYIGTEPLGLDDAWVAKAPHSASGRERLRRRGRTLLGEERVRAERLLSRHGELVVEPWMPRVADYGCSGIVGNTIESSILFAPHQLRCDSTGVVRAIRIADSETICMLGAEHARAIAETTEAVARALFLAGYRGAFGVDSFTYLDRSGKTRLQSLCEINARLSFGLVARAHAEQLSLSEFEFKP